tara:strand:+ start:4372 stop:4866 length:495 start_codon:yes stop_codon:yes gene_type:complete
MSSDEYRARILKRIENFHERTKKDDSAERAAARELKPKRKTKQSSVPTERQEQVRVAKLLDQLGLLWCHVPNEGHGRRGKEGAIRGARLRAEGLKSGVPDILVFDKNSRPGSVGLAIELKRQKGGRVSEDQKRWLEELEKRGWVCKVCRGFDEVHQVLKELNYV